ncbi:hypothetical protein N7448_003956 [Penicillium atrosanguineum]|uniref:Uncharacterized protein n=1 Tax=Penicillium atrosanguineum TaxID=1132637 RepID=A0A9W9U4D1_9EURO|nr:uncharacterized protein N7443_002922 [Penicillium atrosanguineum]KAJ5122823.1 hypothetical protein N7526_009760 [Penicillium atrosanguineum]KAJ5140548.1 hypothetical protein N7448_003956 [Penicillium atrosanguineum]KAJ5310461.1 hypothetical protein N7443_002922 [Penicillium atrosanguineum]KAJ5315981.1 hypothetical protein N7476_006288 [Penicillium atrosanguineum]
MADDKPVTAPAEAGKPEPTSADKLEVSETVAASDENPTEPANTTDDKKEPEADGEEPAASGDATEPKGDDENAAAPADAEDGAPKTNGTPASAKKSSKDRRRSSGVGEKSKSLSRKKSQVRMTQLNAKPGEYYLARLRSYAPWPSIICDEEIMPNTLLDNRPVTAMQKDGTYRADYADDGKRAHERTFPVMFFGTNEFAWVPNTQLTPLDPADCKDISEKNKAKGLIAAYKVAAEGHDLQHFKNLLADHQAALQQEIEEAEAEENAKATAKAEKAKKNKRKSKGAETDVDMEDADEKKPKSSKKRKNEAETEAEKPAKTPKTSTKLKLTTPKAPAEEKKTPASKTKKAPAKKGKAAAKDDEEAVEAKEPEKQIDPEELKKKKEKEVLFLRHKLQKGFISRDAPPKEDEMATMSTYFDKLEKHTDLEVSIIRSTKINKVLKMIVKLNTIPRDEEFNFRQRAMNILSSWKTVLDSDTPVGDKDSKPTANGSSKEDDGADTPKLETEEEKEPETKAASEDTPMPDVDADKPEETETEKETTEVDKSEEKTVEASA